MNATNTRRDDLGTRWMGAADDPRDHMVQELEWFLSRQLTQGADAAVEVGKHAAAWPTAFAAGVRPAVYSPAAGR